jgi:hypothetical protein
MIDPYEKIIMIMRNQGSGTGEPFVMGNMKTATKVSVGDLVLSSGDYLKLSGVSLSKGDDVLIAVVSDVYIIIGKVVS